MSIRPRKEIAADAKEIDRSQLMSEQVRSRSVAPQSTFSYANQHSNDFKTSLGIGNPKWDSLKFDPSIFGGQSTNTKASIPSVTKVRGQVAKMFHAKRNSQITRKPYSHLED